MNRVLAHQDHRKLSRVLDSISIIESQISAGPGDPLPPPTERETAVLKAEKDALVDALTGHLDEVESLRRRTRSRLQHEALRRLSRATGGRTIDRLADHLDATGESVRLEHKTASGETVTIALTPTAPLGADVLPCVVDDRIIYLRVVAPEALCRPVPGDLNGPDALALIRLCERLTIAAD